MLACVCAKRGVNCRAACAYLASGGVEMGGRHVEQIVLYQVEQRRHADEHRVAPLGDDAIPSERKRVAAVLVDQYHAHSASGWIRAPSLPREVPENLAGTNQVGV